MSVSIKYGAQVRSATRVCLRPTRSWASVCAARHLEGQAGAMNKVGYLGFRYKGTQRIRQKTLNKAIEGLWV